MSKELIGKNGKIVGSAAYAFVAKYEEKPRYDIS